MRITELQPLARAMQMFSLRGMAIALTAFALSATANAQAFNSGSDGSDGALTLTSAGTYIFDPLDAATFGRVLDSDGDGVYNFTTITIGVGVTLALRGDKVNRPIYWLASGAVQISGTVSLNGEFGIDTGGSVGLRRKVAVPGSGGYSGGAAGGVGTPVTPGEGPGGGTGGLDCGGGDSCGKGGVFSGNFFLVPLVGGSGGEGSYRSSRILINGGAGGGALLVASSTSISVNAPGGISAVGGNSSSNYGGGGSGGGIRLVAPVITGSGSLSVEGGVAYPNAGRGGSGWVRLEAFSIAATLAVSPAGQVTQGTPGHISTLRPASAVRVTAVDGIALPPNPTGTFALPDVVINKSGPVNVDIHAAGIPPGTIVTLQVRPDTPTDILTINLPPVTTTLTGTLDSSNATVSFTFPFGFSRGTLRATW